MSSRRGVGNRRTGAPYSPNRRLASKDSLAGSAAGLAPQRQSVRHGVTRTLGRVVQESELERSGDGDADRFALRIVTGTTGHEVEQEPAGSVLAFPRTNVSPTNRPKRGSMQWLLPRGVRVNLTRQPVTPSTATGISVARRRRTVAPRSRPRP